MNNDQGSLEASIHFSFVAVVGEIRATQAVLERREVRKWEFLSSESF
jgi:hypothetical protein